jgi:putative ubiquitin-RnfH superfamily antitoxin RatB of RatAB toxin-antitoxin module
MKAMSLIDKIDKTFYEKSKKDTMIIYLLAVVVIGFVFFYFIIPQAKSYRMSEYNTNIDLKGQINTFKRENRTLSNRVFTLNKNIKDLAVQKKVLIKQKAYYDELSGLLNYVDFNKEEWGEFVKNLVINAQKDGLRVESFSNLIINDSKAKGITEKMIFSVRLRGTYKNLVYFLYSYENRKDLLRVAGISMDSKREYVVNFIMYGYEK